MNIEYRRKAFYRFLLIKKIEHSDSISRTLRGVGSPKRKLRAGGQGWLNLRTFTVLTIWNQHCLTR
jgi:hypothetical protein